MKWSCSSARAEPVLRKKCVISVQDHGDQGSISVRADPAKVRRSAQCDLEQSFQSLEQ